MPFQKFQRMVTLFLTKFFRPSLIKFTFLDFSICFCYIALPSLVLSLIIYLSNSAKANIICRINFPVGLWSINPILRTWTATSLFKRNCTSSKPSVAVLAIRSILVIMRVSLNRITYKSLSSSGLWGLVSANESA